MSVWERLRRALERLLGEGADELGEPAQDLHWRPLPNVAEVACGATGFLRWTGESKSATCAECLAIAGPMIRQSRMNSR